MARLPEDKEFEIARVLTNGTREKWIIPTSTPLEGESIEVAESLSLQYWSLEEKEQDRSLWSIYVSCDGSSEKFYVSYQSTSEDVTLQTENAQDWMRHFEALLQPDGGVVMKTADGNVAKFLRATLQNGKTILTASEEEMSWLVRKKFDAVTEGAWNEKVPKIPSRIFKEGTQDYWISTGLKVFDQIRVAPTEKGKRLWWVGRYAVYGNGYFGFAAKDPLLQVKNDEESQSDVIVAATTKALLESRSGSYILTSAGSGAVTIATREETQTFMAVADAYLCRDSDISHAVKWEIDVVGFPYFGPKGRVHYYPPVCGN